MDAGAWGSPFEKLSNIVIFSLHWWVISSRYWTGSKDMDYRSKTPNHVGV
jgi:hypothetical protein